jgi:hypothetical protein
VATASVTNNFTNGTPADAEEVDTNFSDITTFLNNSVVHRDGSKAMTAALDAGGFRVSNVASPTAASDAARWDQAAPTDFQTLGVNTTITTGGVVVVTFSVNSPGAGLAKIVYYGNVTWSGITYNSGMVALRLTSVSGVTQITPATTTNLVSSTVDSSAVETQNFAGPIGITLPSGSNSIALTFSRANLDLGGGSPTGGTLQLDSGFRFGLIGMA